MSDLAITRRKFKTKLLEKQNTSDAIPALLGKGNGEVEVLNQPGQVYIRVGNEENFGTAFNNRVPNSDNLPVFVGYDPITDIDRRLFQVLSIRQTAYVDAGNTPIPQIGPHHTTHEFGGGDDVYIEWRRLMGLRVGRPVAFVVTVDWGYICRAGIWIQAPVGVNTVDLTAEQAALVGTQAQLILVSLDANGAVEQTNGTIKASPLALTISDCPTPPAGNIPLAAVRIYATQTAIGDTPTNPDILDLRFPTYNAMNNGGVAGNDTEIQYNDGGVFGADSDFTFDDVNKSLLVGGAHGIGALGNNSIVNTGEGHSASFVSVIYGTNNPAFAGFHARGSLAIPTKALSGDYLLTVGGRGYATAGWESGARGSFNIVASEDHDTSHGTYATIRTTPIGGIATQDVARFDNASGIINYATNLYTTKDHVITFAGTGTAALLNTVWTLTGNSGTTPVTNFVGTSDAVDLVLARNSAARVRLGSAGVSVGLTPPVPTREFHVSCNTGSRTTGAVLISDTGIDGNGNAMIDYYRTGTNAADWSLGLASGTASFALSRTGSGQIIVSVGYTTGQFTIHGYDHVTPQLKVAYDSTHYFTVNVAASGAATFATLPVDAGFTFTPTVTFTAAPILSTMTAGWLPYMGASKEVVGSANATLDASGNALFNGNITTATTKWLGLGAAAGRLTFTDAATDTAVFSDCNVGIGATTTSVLLHLGTGGTKQGYIRLEDAANAGREANIYIDSGGGLHIDTNSNAYPIKLDGLSVTVKNAFGCNGAAAQTAYASGGALAAYGAGANGLDSGANMSALHALVVKIRAALVANGIMS